VPSAPSQFRLLAERRFLPYFASQSLGAFNDNLLKNGLVLLATFSTGLQAEIAPELLANLAGGLFILPFLLFSGLAGQLADRYDKALILKIVKAAEIAIMALAGWGFAQGNLLMLLASLFLMGLHSTFFAPAKYGLLPQVLRSEELVGGNALVETGTFLAILGGTLTAGLLVADGHAAQVSQALMLAAVLGFAASLAIPALPARAPGSRIDWNPWTSTLDNLRAAKRLLKNTQIGISLTPMPECLPSLPQTIAWLKAQGIDALTMSPTLYNRGGSLTDHELATAQLRQMIEQYGLRSQEFDFVPSAGEVFRQWRANRFKCVPRNVDLFISSSGDYLYCYNDAAHQHPIGHVSRQSIGEMLRQREAMGPLPALCDGCNMRDRYRVGELFKAGIAFARARLQPAAA